MKNKNYIGYVEETVYGVVPNKEPIELLQKSEEIISEKETHITAEGRFDCPHCGYGISLKIESKI